MPTSDLVSVRAGILGGGRRRGRPSWQPVFRTSVGAAVVFHAAVLFLWPRFEVPTESANLFARHAPRLMEIAALREIELPAPPREREKPAAPISPASAIPDHQTAPAIPPVPQLDFDLDLPVVDLPDLRDRIVTKIPELPAEVTGNGGTTPSAEGQWKNYEAFSPRMVRPEIRNRREVEAFLSRRYTPILRRTGATGVAQVIFWIDEKGLAQRAEIAVSSGSVLLDELATGDLAKVLRFRPAIRDGEPVKVHVIVPIRFEAAML